MLLDACFSFFSAHATAVHPCHAPGAQMSRALWMALAENYARFRAESLRKQQEWAEQSLQQTADVCPVAPSCVLLLQRSNSSSC
eukprot:m.399810 g.399810  ORF g.399810 m.399810 type:complete len:84 (+) comp56437_c0_seq12:62-313(+)